MQKLFENWRKFTENIDVDVEVGVRGDEDEHDEVHKDKNEGGEIQYN